MTVASGIAAAILLARGREAALGLLPNTPEVARHSFRAALFCLPVFLLLRAMSFAEHGAPRDGAMVGLLAETAGFVIAWAGFALASRAMADQAGRLDRWPGFVAAWNWSNLVQYALLLLLAVPTLLGMPAWLVNGLGLAALGYALWLEWFVTRVALGVPGPAAVLFVMLDLAIGLFAGALAGRISGS